MLINALEILHVCWFCLKLGQVSSRLSLTNYKLLSRPWAFELVLKLVPAPLCFQVAALKRCSSIESMNRFQLFLSLSLLQKGLFKRQQRHGCCRTVNTWRFVIMKNSLHLISLNTATILIDAFWTFNINGPWWQSSGKLSQHWTKRSRDQFLQPPNIFRKICHIKLYLVTVSISEVFKQNINNRNISTKTFFTIKIKCRLSFSWPHWNYNISIIV